jgi:hypothetical protein
VIAFIFPAILSLLNYSWIVEGNLVPGDLFSPKINKKIIEKAFKLYFQLLSEDADCLKVFKDVIIA